LRSRPGYGVETEQDIYEITARRCEQFDQLAI
jgi:hypothetical protein